MRLIYSILFLLISTISFAQVVAEGDTVLCSGQEGQVGITLSATSFAVDLTDSGIDSDDEYGGVVNMGFNFEKFITLHNSLIISNKYFFNSSWYLRLHRNNWCFYIRIFCCYEPT